MTDTITTTLPENAPIEGERHVSEVAGRSAFTKKAGVGVIVTAAVLACGAVVLTSAKPDLKLQTTPLQLGPKVSYEAPPPLPAQPAATPPLPDQAAPPLPTQPVTLPAGNPTGQAPAAKPPARLLVFNAGGSSNPSAGGASMQPAAYQGGQGGYGAPGGVGGPEGQGGQQGGDGLGARLQATPLTGVSANVLRNQPYLLTTGTVMPCVLQTAMDSTLPGFVTCVVPQDILGKTGIVLLDRGTKVVGQFQGGMRQGVERMFVLWTRAETPQGVVINLDSPATDPLGRSGMDGEIERHFWQRFGGALLLSTVDGVLSAGQAAVAKSGTVTVNTSNSSGVIGQSLSGSVNIPPTIRKNQGELVSIFVARDLDFSSVYRVAPAPMRYPAGGSAR